MLPGFQFTDVERKPRVPSQESVLDNLLWKQEFPNRECWIKQHGYIKSGLLLLLLLCWMEVEILLLMATIPNVMFLMGGSRWAYKQICSSSSLQQTEVECTKIVDSFSRIEQDLSKKQVDLNLRVKNG